MTAGPGLNLDQLRGIRQSTVDLDRVRDRIGAHLDDLDGFVAFSGGKDSLVVLDLARQVDASVPVVFYDSGLEYPETYAYLEQLQQHWRLNLEVIPARHTVLEVLAGSGHWDHTAPDVSGVPNLRRILIDEPAAVAHDRHGPGVLWGVRSQESHGRAMAYRVALRDSPGDSRAEQRQQHGGVIRRVDGTVAFGPIWDWRHPQVWGHIAGNRLPVNPVYAKLRQLGAPDHALRVSHMLDAGGLEQGRAVWLRRGWPAIYENLAAVLPRLREFT